MKKWLLSICILLASYSYADQLAYISKSEAESAVEVISKMKKVHLFCGCCSLKAPVEVKPTKVYSRFTNYENYYEVVIEFINDRGETELRALDLAYVWKKKCGKYKTIGAILNLEHDPCTQPEDWNKPKNNEED